MKADGFGGESGQNIWYSFFTPKPFVYAAQSLPIADTIIRLLCQLCGLMLALGFWYDL